MEKEKLEETQLILGYEKKGLVKCPIVVNMKIVPPILISGLYCTGEDVELEVIYMNG